MEVSGWMGDEQLGGDALRVYRRGVTVMDGRGAAVRYAVDSDDTAALHPTQLRRAAQRCTTNAAAIHSTPFCTRTQETRRWERGGWSLRSAGSSVRAGWTVWGVGRSLTCTALARLRSPAVGHTSRTACRGCPTKKRPMTTASTAGRRRRKRRRLRMAASPLLSVAAAAAPSSMQGLLGFVSTRSQICLGSGPSAQLVAVWMERSRCRGRRGDGRAWSARGVEEGPTASAGRRRCSRLWLSSGRSAMRRCGARRVQCSSASLALSADVGGRERSRGDGAAEETAEGQRLTSPNVHAQIHAPRRFEG